MATLKTPPRVIAQGEIANQVYGLSIYLPRALAKAVALGLDKNADPITEAMYKAIKKGVIPSGIMKKANLELAHMAQNAMVTGWHERLPVKAPGYRTGGDPQKNRLSGALGAALADEQMVKGTSDRGISFINTNFLNNEARHWYRVNYGAFGPKAVIRRPKAFPVNVGGKTLMVLKDEAEPARNSWLPKRFSYRPDYTYFTPIKSLPGQDNKADVHGGGTRAAVFTDLGFQAVAKNADTVYRTMFTGYISQRGVKTHLKGKGVRIRATKKGVTGG